MFKTNCLLFILAVLSVSVFADSVETYSNLRFKSFSTHEGLSQSSVLSIAQDAQGLVWMGTKDGLNRFDGYRFIAYKNVPNDNNSISNNEVIFLLPDKDGNLFIGTRGGGLNFFVKDENRFVRFDNLKTLDGTVTYIHQQSDGAIWVGTNQGLFLGIPDSSKNSGFHFSNFSNKSVFLDQQEGLLAYNRDIVSVVSVFEISENQFLIGTFRGLFLFKKNDLSFVQVELGKQNNAKVNSIVADHNNLIWVGTSEGLVRLSKSDNNDLKLLPQTQQPEWNQLNNGWVERLLIDKEGNLWVGTRGAGIMLIDNNGSVSEFYTSNMLSNKVGDNIINSLMIDRGEVLWMGTESKGVVTLDLNRKKFNHLDNHSASGRNLNNNLVTAIAGKNNEVWVGSAYNGLDYLQFRADKTVEAKHYPQIPYGNKLSSSEVISLELDTDNNLWIGTASNYLVSYRDDAGFQSYFTGSFAFALHQDRKENLWIGTWGKGLGLMDKNSREIKFLANNPNDSRTLSGDIILTIFDDNKGNLWVGTKGRGLSIAPLNRVKQGYNSFVIYEKGNQLLHNDVYCVHQDSDDVIWVGTGGGLNWIDAYKDADSQADFNMGRAHFGAFTEADGLPANIIYGILEDNDGNLWISTTKGLSKFNKKTNTFKNYTTDDGLQSDEFHSNAFYASPENQLFFGGVNGLSFFNPSEITSNQQPSEVIFSDFKVASLPVKPHQKVNGKVILNKDISKSDVIALTHKHKDFTIEFTAEHLNRLEGIRYAYRLLGFNDEWRYLSANEHSVTYTNLWEGDYVFQVKATNKDGVWNELPKELKIEVMPPLWRNKWFYSVYLLLLVAGLLLFRRYTLIGVAEKNRLLIEHIERTNLIENTEAKMRFFTNISHEIRTPLTLINNPLEEVIAKGKIDDKSKESLQLVSKNVNRLLNLTNQLLQLRKIDKGGVEPQFSEVKVVKMVKDIIGLFLQKALNKEITMGFESDVDADQLICVDQELITTAIYNVVSNAYKFTPSKGRINIKVYKHKDEPARIRRWRKVEQGDSKEWICIDVSDTGPGISSEEIKHIFHRFYQSKQNVRKEIAGSGIGLSIVKEYIDMHQGKIETRSKVGEGSTFTIFLPLGNAHLKNSKVLVPSENEIAAMPTLVDESEEIKTKETLAEKDLPVVLIVEDDRDLRHYLKETLSENYKVYTAADGKKGIEKAVEVLPSIVISDVMMPNVDGLELCETLKKDERTRHIPVILLTAKAADESRIEGYKSGADLYVSKPFKPDVLKSEIDQLLNTRRILAEVFSKQIFLKPRDIEISSADEKFLTKLNDTIDEHLAEPDFDVSAMVEKMNFSHSTVLKKVKSLTGMSLVEFVKIHRLKRAAQILEKDRFQIAEVAYLVGFSDPKYFSKCFSKEFGKTPTEYVQEMRTKQDEGAEN